MSLDADVLENWIRYAAKTIYEIAQNMQKEREEYADKLIEEAASNAENSIARKEYDSIIAMSNTLHVLANMYSMYNDVRKGSKPKLKRRELKIFGMALQDYKSIDPPIWIQVRHPEIVSSLEDAYMGLGKYLAGIRK